MSLLRLFSRRLYLRIWLAVVGGVAVLTLLVAWAWQTAAEFNAQQNSASAAPAREIVLRDGNGEVLAQGLGIRRPGDPSEGLRFDIAGADGQTFSLQMAPRGQRGERPPPHGPAAFWLRPFGFLWMLALVGIAVALGVFPIIRRLLKRLEHLQRSVQRFGEGDLATRVPVQGNDELADLSRQFNASAERIEALMASQKSLLANASHELRSPLTRIRMGMELMSGEQPSPASRAEILRNVNELDQLVDEILLASRLDSREVDVGTEESVDLIGLCAEECARIDAELQLQDLAELEVPGVAKLLRRAVRNLLENARRYSHGEITLELAHVDGQAEIRVDDRGPGVPADQRERIFEKFYRLPGASERSGGVGLGLALVRSIAERHGGSVRCEAREGGGARFVLRLPLA
ncbi:MAG: ATP-binding protein [Comamonas sp.]